MHKPHILLFTCLTLAAFISCQKIENDSYLRPAGTVGTWHEGVGVSDKNQRVLLEKYTGPRCAFCPNADLIIADASARYGSKLIAVAIHDSSSFGRPLGIVDLRTDEGNAWCQYFEITQHPIVMLNRTKENGQWLKVDPLGGVNDPIQTALQDTAGVAISIRCVSDADSLLQITVNLDALTDIPGELMLNLIITEDSIVAPQMQSSGQRLDTYIHNHVLRQVITDIWGTPLPSTLKKADRLEAQFEYVWNSANLNIRHCHIVAFLTEKESHRVLNCDQCSIESAL